MAKRNTYSDIGRDGKSVTRYFALSVAGLTCLFGCSLFLEIRSELSAINEYALVEGRATYNKDLLYRRWASMHGGVYVPVTDETPPNPMLSHIPDRDITTDSGVRLTLVNPAYMTRQVHDIAKGQYGVRGHITSLNPIREGNRPDEWETKALQLFETGELEYSSIERIDGMKYMRFMHAMTVEQGCLRCHAVQGYQVGDIRGGISVSVPMAAYDELAASNIKKQSATYVLVYAVVLMLAVLGFRRLKKEVLNRSLVQAKLMESEELLCKSQELAHLGSWDLDLTSNELTWSDETYRIVGCNPHEFTATYEFFLDSIHPDDRVAVSELYSRSLREGADSYDIEHRFVRRDTGEIRHVHERCVHVRDDAGAVVRSVGMVQDITDRKRAEGSLVESEGRYRSLFENMNAGFVLFEVVQDEESAPMDLVILAANQGFAAATGLKIEDAVGKRLSQVLPGIEKDAADWIGTYGKVALTGEPRQFEQGSEHLGFHYSVAAFRARPNECAVTFIDITARKAAEVELRRLLEQIERDRSGLLSTLEDQRRTEKALRESEERFRRAVIGAPFPIMIHAEDGQVVTVNTPWTGLTGYEHSDIPTIADWTRKAYGTEMALVRAYIDGLYALDGPKAEGEHAITTSTGESLIWEFSSAPIGRLPDGRRLVISMAMDVTERKRLETERQKFFLLAESSSEFIGMCDLDMNPLYVNPAGRRMVGLPDMAAACQVKVQDYYFPEEQRFIAEEFFPRVLREGHGDVEIRLRHFQTGEPVWMFYSLFSVHDASGTPVGWATVSRDITERRKAAEDATRMSRLIEESQAIAHLGSFEFIAATHETIWSEEEYRIYGLDPNGPSPDYDVMLERCIHPDDAQLLHDTFTAAMQNRGLYELEHRIVRPDGSVRWVYDRAHPFFDDDGNLLRYAGATLDITERKRASDQLARLSGELESRVKLRTAQLEATNKEMEAFSYSVSHDLRAPLRHISGYVDLLNTRFREALPEKAAHYLSEVTDSAKQMGTLIDDLLEFSRAGRQELRQADMDMNAAVQEVLALLAADTKDRQISWTVAELPRVFGDPSLLKQVWMNLLDNAVKYTRYRDKAIIEVGFTREPDHWVFFVRDNGVGFDMQYVHKLFGVFQRLHSSDEFAGTGIGLANVQRIIHKHGGRAWAEGRLDEGAAFYFAIPDHIVDEGGSSWSH